MNWNVDGHKRQLDLLENAFNQGVLAHGYMFAGPEGVGKRTIAKKLAMKILGQETEQQNFFHPDFFEIDGKQGIKIEQIRELIYKLSLKPYSAPYKVAVIDNADEMTLEAANALLKSLEEPKSHTIIILITSNSNKLPKTIVSRVQKINFGLVKGRESKPSETDRFEIFSGKNLVERLILAAEVADLETIELKNLLQSWLIRLTENLRTSPSMSVKQNIDQINYSLQSLEMNASAKLLMTNLMLNT